jgi:hypothetical protein
MSTWDSTNPRFGFVTGHDFGRADTAAFEKNEIHAAKPRSNPKQFHCADP